HVDVRFQTGLDQATGPIVLASFKSEGIPPGGYVIQAISDSDWGTNEAEILILDAERYQEYWQSLGREESVDYRSIERLADMLECVSEVISGRLGEQFRASGVDFEFRLADVRRVKPLGPIPAIRRATF